jgi:hypothetical protein
MIGVSVRDDCPWNGSPRIDVKVTNSAVKTVAIRPQE